jgi:hypothetical protein
MPADEPKYHKKIQLEKNVLIVIVKKNKQKYPRFN